MLNILNLINLRNNKLTIYVAIAIHIYHTFIISKQFHIVQIKLDKNTYKYMFTHIFNKSQNALVQG